MLPESTKAYAAGLIDGEGWIGIAKTPGRCSLRVQVGMTDLGGVEFLQANFGGHLHLKRLRPPRKPLYEWRIYGQEASQFLRTITAYLTVKRPQAQLAIEFAMEAANQPRWNNKRGHSEVYKAYQDKAYQQMKILNGRWAA